MTKEEYLAAYPWISPTIEYRNKFIPIEGVHKVEEHKHVLVSTGATHKTIDFFNPINSNDIEKIDGKDWELFSVSHEGEIDGVKYYWGMFVEGLGWFNVQVVQEHCRELLPQEREVWSKKTLGMYGSHSGNLSYTLPSGIKS